MSELEETFAGQLRMLFMDHGWKQEAIQREYRFCEDRKWQADFAILIPRWADWLRSDHDGTLLLEQSLNLLIEIEGGTRQGGRHNYHDGYTNDAYKYSAASALGYTVLRGTSQMVHDGTLLKMAEEVLLGELKISEWKAA